MGTKPVRIDAEIHAAAERVAGTMSRSVAQQLGHWARIGQHVEAASRVSHARITSVLDGTSDYDDTLNDFEQAAVRAEWAERIEARRKSLDLGRQFDEQGQSWVGLDEAGSVVEHTPPNIAE